MKKAHMLYAGGGVGLVLVLLLAWMMILSPRMAEASEIRAEAATVEQGNQALQLKVDTLNSQLANSASVVETGKQHALQFPPTADLPGLFRDINMAAAKAGIPGQAVMTLSPAAPTIGGGAESGGATLPDAATGATLATMTVSMTVEGDYGQMVRFMGNLENLERVYLLSGVSLAGGDGGKYSASIDGDMFLLRQDDLQTLLDVVEQLNGSVAPAPAPVPTGSPSPNASVSTAPTAAASATPSTQTTDVAGIPVPTSVPRPTEPTPAATTTN